MKVLQIASLKSFYAYVNRTIYCKLNFGPLFSLTDPNTLLYLDMDKANTFNSYFHNVFTLDNSSLPNFPLRTDKNMAPFTFSLKEVRNVFKLSRSFCTIRTDGFSAYLLPTLAGELAAPTNALFDISVTQGGIPEC